MLTFKPISKFKLGDLAKVIHSSYSDLVERYPQYWEQEKEKWDEKVTEIFKENNVQKAVVSTSEHPFFKPAQKMYRSLGFKEVTRTTGGPDPNFKTIKFKKKI